MRAAEIARALGGKPNGSGYLCRCPVPSHGRGRGDCSPSLSVRDGEERLLLCCFAGCDARVVLDELRRRGLLDDDRKPVPRPIRPHAVTPHEPDARALDIWHQTQAAPGTVAEKYLRGSRDCRERRSAKGGE
jgi:putative DNA primase/helicase